MIEFKSTTLIALCAVALLDGTSLRAEERMRAGLWEVTSLLNGKPTGTSGNTCYTNAMVEVANSPAIELRERTESMAIKRGCTVKDFKIEGNRMSMTKICGGRTAVIYSTHSGDKFETVDTTTEAGVTKVMHMKGRRIGDCK